MKYLVYIKGIGRVEAQIWHQIQTDGYGKSLPFLEKYDIPIEKENFSIDQLKLEFPYKGE